MEHDFSSSIPHLWFFAGYGARFFLFYTPVLVFRGVWSAIFSFLYPGFGFSQGMEHDYFSSIPQFWFFAGYGAQFFQFYTPALIFRRVWRVVFSLLYPDCGFLKGMENFYSSVNSSSLALQILICLVYKLEVDDIIVAHEIVVCPRELIFIYLA